LIGSACARHDWIEETLVTVDVTGVWRGDSGRGGSAYGGGSIELTLEQNGPKVTGQVRSFAGGHVPIEGTVNGDKLSLHNAKGFTAELQVNGDEMTGSSTGATGIMSYHLRRAQ
jgi:hypothetical protein